MFITFEGTEGVGKSVQIRFLKEYLERTNQKALFLREPGGTKISEKIRDIITNPEHTEMSYITEALLFASARAQLVQEVIKPAQEKGELIFCDRFVDSSVAYQGYGRDLGPDFIWNINKPAVDNCMPDYTIFLNLHPKDSFRHKVVENDRMELQKAEFYEKVYNGFLDIASKDAKRYILITPCQEKEETHQKILNALRERGIIKWAKNYYFQMH